MHDISETKENNVLIFAEKKDKKDIRIIKCKRKDNFTKLSNDCINDENLSGDAFKILAYVLSKPEDWIVYASDLCARFKRSPNKIYALMKELINLGYMRRYQPRDESGRVLPWVTKVADEPIFKNAEPLEPRILSPHINLPQAVKTGRGKMNTTKKEYTNKDNKQNNNNNKHDGNSAKVNLNISKTKPTVEPDGSVVVLMEEMKHLNLNISKEVITKLVKKYGAPRVKEKIPFVKNGKWESREGAFITAIIENWDPSSLRPPENKQESLKEQPTYPSHQENVAWYNALSEQEKLECFHEACSKQSTFEEHLKLHKITVLDPAFNGHYSFKMFMELLGRAK